MGVSSGQFMWMWSCLVNSELRRSACYVVYSDCPLVVVTAGNWNEIKGKMQNEEQRIHISPTLEVTVI